VGYIYGKRRGILAVLVFLVIILLCAIAIITLTSMLNKENEDDGKIGVNVVSGECKLDIVDKDGKSLLGDVLDFVSNSGEQVIFEPGATYYTEGFSVKNIGTVDVEYRVYISDDEKLAEADFKTAFDMWITKDPANLEQANKLTSFTGELKTTELSDTYYLVIRMKQTAGNEFQNKTYSGIGITVYAVQAKADME